MTQVMDPKPAGASTDTDDLTTAIQRVLAASSEPLTVPKIRAGLPAALRQANVEDVLRRQVTANVWHQYPKYRSQHDRYWDRPMPVHIVALIRTTLEENGPLGWSELRRKLPAYAQQQAEGILNEQLTQKRLHRHPRSGGRGSERFGVDAPDAKDYLRDELGTVFHRLKQLGFNESQIRAGAMELLHDEEWAPAPPVAKTPQRKAEVSEEQPRTEAGQTSAAAPSRMASQAPVPTRTEQPAAAGSSQQPGRMP